jgi:3-oxoacyl-[acyl-carrier protein] reductase
LHESSKKCGYFFAKKEEKSMNASVKETLKDAPDIALVTGGAGGIGREICKRLAEDGFRVVVADVGDAPDLPAEFIRQRLDVRDAASVEAAFENAAQHGKLKAVVISHGVIEFTDIETATEEDMTKITDVNLLGVARVCRAAAHWIVDNGAIVNISSVVASMGRARGAFVYCATKAGVEAITRSYAVGLGPRGVRVNAVAPGFLSQPMSGEGARMRAEQGGNEKLLPFSPMGRLATPKEVAEVVAFLCSEKASGISGAVIPVDAAQRAL